MTETVYKVCAECESDNISVPTKVVWHAADERWIVHPFFGVTEEDLKKCTCSDCGHVGAPKDSIED
jgi:hypothetical protein